MLKKVEHRQGAKEWRALLRSSIETHEDAKAEDRLRARLLCRTLRLNEPLTEESADEIRYLQNRALPHLPLLPVPDLPGRVLFRKLRASAEGEITNTLASSVRFRKVRIAVVARFLAAFDDFADHDLRVVTVIKSTQRVSPEDLLSTPATRLKDQFRADLKRSGVAAISGPFVAFLHCEFESASGVYVFHWHIITTAEKAEALKNKFAKLRTYPKTPTGSPAIFVQMVNDRVSQFSYLLQSYWPMKGAREVNGATKRDRTKQRIAEPFGSRALLWMDRQRLCDICVMNGAWSPRSGGEAKMRTLYRSIFRHS